MVKVVVNDWPGLLVILITFFMVYTFWKIKKDKKLTLTLGFILLFHHFVAIINTYFFTFPGAEKDPLQFHTHAIEWAESGKWIFSVGAIFYEQLLGIFYRIFVPSQLFGGELSVFVFLLSCFILIELLGLLNISKYAVLLLIVYGLLPTHLIFFSKILRESYQIFFLMLSIYWGLRFHLKPNNRAMIYCVLSVLIMGFFHKALTVYVFILLPALMLWFPQQISSSYSRKWNLSKHKLIAISLILIFVTGIFVVSILSDVGDMEATKSFLTGKGFKYAADYRTRLLFKKAPDARANYRIILDTASLESLIKSASVSYIYYLFAPFPWQVSNYLDFYAFTESFFRFILIVFSILFWYKAEGFQRRICGLSLFIYFSMTFLWAMGTVNYGASIRHHTLTNWMIIILGGSMFIDLIARNFRRVLPATK